MVKPKRRVITSLLLLVRSLLSRAEAELAGGSGSARSSPPAAAPTPPQEKSRDVVNGGALQRQRIRSEERAARKMERAIEAANKRSAWRGFRR
jgi:hypothetical protein